MPIVWRAGSDRPVFCAKRSRNEGLFRNDTNCRNRRSGAAHLPQEVGMARIVRDPGRPDRCHHRSVHHFAVAGVISSDDGSAIFTPPKTSAPA